jgi:hypothetical protein
MSRILLVIGFICWFSTAANAQAIVDAHKLSQKNNMQCIGDGPCEHKSVIGERINVEGDDDGIKGPFAIPGDIRADQGEPGQGAANASSATSNAAVSASAAQLSKAVADFKAFESKLTESHTASAKLVDANSMMIEANIKQIENYQLIIDYRDADFNTNMIEAFSEVREGLEREFQNAANPTDAEVLSLLESAKNAIDGYKSVYDAIDVMTNAEVLSDKIQELKLANEKMQRDAEVQKDFQSRYQAALEAARAAGAAAEGKLAGQKAAKQ